MGFGLWRLKGMRVFGLVSCGFRVLQSKVQGLRFSDSLVS